VVSIVALLALVCALFLVCHSNYKIAQASSGIIRRASQSDAKKDEFILGVVWKFHERAWTFSVNKELSEFVRAKGLMPFMIDPHSKVQAEIVAIQKNLGFTREQAIDWIRSNYTMQPEESVNGVREG